MIQESLWNNFENQKPSENTGSLFLEKIIQKLSQESSTDSLSKASNMILEKIDIQIKYSLEKNNILFETQDLIANSLKNTLPTHLQEYNISWFDIDKNGEIDETEEQRYLQELWKMLNQILQLQSTKKFEKIHQDIDEKWDVIWAEYLNFSQNIDENFVNNLVKSWLEISEDEYTKMREKDFNITSFESIKELWILIWNEIWTWLVDVLKLSASIFSSAALIPRYTYLRIDRFSDDKNEALAADIQIEELVRENPALWLVELLWEQWVEMIKNLANMMTSWKQWDIATILVSIFWLLAGWAGAAKLVSNMTRKWLVNWAKKWYINTSRWIRNGIKTISNWLGNFADTMGNIDNTIAFAWAWVLLPNHLAQAETMDNKDRDKLEAKKVAAEKRTWISREQLEINSKWVEEGNLELPNEILEKNALNIFKWDIEWLINIHENISKWLWKNWFWDIRNILEEWLKIWLERPQIRILMENWIFWKLHTETSFQVWRIEGEKLQNINNQLHWLNNWEELLFQLEWKNVIKIFKYENNLFYQIGEKQWPLSNLPRESGIISSVDSQWFQTMRITQNMEIISTNSVKVSESISDTKINNLTLPEEKYLAYKTQLMWKNDIISDLPWEIYVLPRIDKYFDWNVAEISRQEFWVDLWSFRLDNFKNWYWVEKSLESLQNILKNDNDQLPILKENQYFYDMLQSSIQDGNYLRTLLLLENPDSKTLTKLQNLFENIWIQLHPTAQNITWENFQDFKNLLMRERGLQLTPEVVASIQRQFDQIMQWKPNFDITNFKLIEAQMHAKPFWGDVVEFLESKWPELNFEELVLAYSQRWAKDWEEFNDWLDWLDKKWVSTEIYTELQNAHQKILIEKKLSGEISNISYKDLELFTQSSDLNNLFEKLNDTKILELLRMDAEKIRSWLWSNIDITKLTSENLQKIFELAKNNDKAWLSNRLLRINIDDYTQLSTRQIHIIESFMDGTLAWKYKYEMLINGINEGKLDINSLSHDRLTSLKNSWNKQFLEANDTMRIEMLENGHPKLFNQEMLDRFFYMGIFDMKNWDELRKIQSYLQPGGKLYEVMRWYDFQLEKIISWIENHIAQLT